MEQKLITSKMSVRDILAQYPESRVVFDRYGLLECGGELGPQEPIGFFATVHKVNADQLLAELNASAQGSGVHLHETREASTQTASAPPKAGIELYKKFVKTAIVLILTGGATLGAINLTMIVLGKTFELQRYHPWWRALVQSHAHVQLYGWCGGFIMGISYVVLPRFLAVELRSRHFAEASFWLMLGGILLRAYYQPFATEPYAAHWLVWSSIAELVAVTLFLNVILQTVRPSAARNEVYVKYLLAGGLWFWITTAALVVLSIRTVITGENVIPPRFDEPYLHAYLLGFAGLYIFGISLRTLPFFMGMREPNDVLSRLSLFGLNLGIVLYCLGRSIPAAHALTVAGAMLEIILSLVLVYNLRVFEKPVNPVILEEVSRDYEKFIRVSYGWLLISAGLLAGYTLFESIAQVQVTHPWMGAYRHAFTVGFITMMIFGMAGRVIPVFEGEQLHSARLLSLSFWLLNIGNLMRVSLQILSGKFGGAFYSVMGISGYLEVTACAIFGYVLWKTMDACARPDDGRLRQSTDEDEKVEGSSDESGALTASTKVLHILERYPDTLAVFRRHGFSQLDNPMMRNTIGKVATLGMACQMHGVAVDELISELNEVIHPRPVAAISPSGNGSAASTQETDLDNGSNFVEKLVWTALSDCYDPEIPHVNIVDLGLVYSVSVNGDGEAHVTMTLTSRGCPMGEIITDIVRQAVLETPGVRSATVEVVFDPPWSPERISEAAKAKLGF